MRAPESWAALEEPGAVAPPRAPGRVLWPEEQPSRGRRFFRRLGSESGKIGAKAARKLAVKAITTPVGAAIGLGTATVLGTSATGIGIAISEGDETPGPVATLTEEAALADTVTAEELRAIMGELLAEEEYSAPGVPESGVETIPVTEEALTAPEPYDLPVDTHEPVYDTPALEEEVLPTVGVPPYDYYRDTYHGTSSAPLEWEEQKPLPYSQTYHAPYATSREPMYHKLPSLSEEY